MSEEEKKVFANLVAFGRRIALQQPAYHAKTDRERDDWASFYEALELVNWLLSKKSTIDIDAVEEKVGFPSVTGATAARLSKKAPIQAAIDMAQLALRSLGKEDLIFSHHGGVQARPEAYKRLASFFEQYADFRRVLDNQASEE
jgi:hypothetical protein